VADQSGQGANLDERNSLDLDALAVSDRFRLFNFTRRDDHVAYLWVLRALDRLRGVHQVQAHTDDVAAALAELAALHDEASRLDGSSLREKLDALADDGMVHRLEDASRVGSLARSTGTGSRSTSSASLATGHVRLVGTQQPTLWDLELGQVMAATGCAVYEETVADPLIADLSAGPNADDAPAL
jgi:hypothetical protein